MTTKHFGPVLAGPAKGDAMNENSSLLLGVLVADAACLGLHWIYNVDRIAEVTERQGGQCAFTPVEARNFEGVKTFAHKDRR